MKNIDQPSPAPTCPKCSSPLVTLCGPREGQCLGCGHKWKDDPLEQFIHETEVLAFHIEQWSTRWGNGEKLTIDGKELEPTPAQAVRLEAAIAKIYSKGSKA